MEENSGRRLKTFNIGMDETPMVSTYEYLGCVVDMFQDCSGMVEDLSEFMITGIGCMVVTASSGNERDE